MNGNTTFQFDQTTGDLILPINTLLNSRTIKQLHEIHEIQVPGLKPDQFTAWQVPYRYQKLKAIGTGAYAIVCEAYDVLLKKKVAIKKMNTPFRDNLYSIRSLRELILLKNMNHENVVNLFYCWTNSTSAESFDSFYVVMPLVGRDLSQVMKYNLLADEHVQYIAYQTLKGLKYIHSAGIVHRDLKPSNIAVDAQVDAKILDFGLARDDVSENHIGMTGYVVTRYYRAPEVITRWQTYNKKIDVWSIACICAELLTGEVLFKGMDHIQQVMLVTKLCGTPDEDFLNSLEPNSQNFMRQTLAHCERQNFKDYFLPRIASHISRKQNLAGVQNLTEQQVNDQINPKAIEFLEFLLEFDPEKRPTAQQALQHPYLAEYYYAEEDDLEIEQVIDTKDFEGYQTGQEQIEVSGCKNRAWELLTTYREEFIEKACHEYSSVITIE